MYSKEKKMKKLLAVTLASLVSIGTVAFVGCGGSDGDNGASGKPSMPSDKNMVSVDREDIGEEFAEYLDKLGENGYGQYQAYARSHSVLIDKFGTITETKEAIHEVTEDYKSIVKDGVVTAALTNTVNANNKAESDREDDLADESNYDYTSKFKCTAIQKGESVYGFETSNFDIRSGKVENDRYLAYYGENFSWLEYSERDYNIPCVNSVNKVYYKYDMGARIISAANRFLGASLYESDPFNYPLGNYSPWLNADAVKSFDFSAKKNDKKIYVSLKYSIEYTTDDYGMETTSKEDAEYVVLIDLSAPASVADLPSDGIDIDNLSLGTATDAAYPALTSEQLTEAIKEGKEITVDIAGNGDVSKLSFKDRNCTVADGKVTIDCAGIKSDIESVKEFFEMMGSSVPVEAIIGCLTVSFTYDLGNNTQLDGSIYADVADYL